MTSERMNANRIGIGIIILVIGTLLLMRQIGLISFSIWDGLRAYWPVLLIIAGLLIILRQGWVAVALLALLGVFLIALVFTFPLTGGTGSQRELHLAYPNDNTVNDMQVNVKYGAGQLSIHGGTGYLVANNVSTSDSQDPLFNIQKEGGKVTADLERQSVQPALGREMKDSWDISLSGSPAISMTLNFGAAEMNLDMTQLKVKDLEINGGASKDTITFGSYPTNAAIKSGASDINLRIPKDAAAVVTVKGGLITSHFNGFRQEGDKFVRDGPGQPIQITVDAGMSNINGDTY